MFVLPDGRPLERIEEELCELAGHLWAGTARFLALLAEFDRREGWAGWGLRSCAHWLSWRCGLSPEAAREQVRVARALGRLPRISEAFHRGELSYSKVRAVSRIATDATEKVLLEWARHGTAAQMERVCRGVRQAQAIGDPCRTHARRSLRLAYDEEGFLEIRGRLPAEEGALVLRALETAVEHLAREEQDDVAAEAHTPEADSVSAETASVEPDDLDAAPPWERRRADALVLFAETFLASGPRALPGAEKALVVVHVDPSTLARDEGDRCEIQGGPPLPAETVRRLACDASLVRVLDGPGGIPLSVGRRSRSVPAAIRRALRVRDRGCRFPGCSAHRRVDAHHIRHWAHGGETSLANLVTLCRRHHRLLHEEGFSMRVEPGGALDFYRPDGRQITTRPPIIEEAGARLIRKNRSAGLAIGPQTCASRWDGKRPDYDLAVAGLMRLAVHVESG